MPPVDVAMMDLIETVTTVPLEPSERMPFWEAVLREEQQPVKRDPLWAVILVLLGAFLSIGAGAFLITIGVMK